MIYAPDTPAANRFPWRMFLSQTKLSKGPFKALTGYEDFLETVACAYETRRETLTDEEMLQCVEKVYFPMFRMHYIQEGDGFEDGNIGRGEGQDAQPQVIGYFYDKSHGIDRDKQKSLRTALKRFSKDLYDDPYAWFKDFEEYFRANEEHE